MEKLGLYTSGREDSYREVEPVGTKAKISFDMPRGRQAEDWFEVVAKRQSERDETEDNYNYAKIEFESDKPVVIGFTGDWHLGSRIDHDMLMRDVSIIAENPDVAGCFLMGDLTDSANFNPAQDENYLSYEEQRQMMVNIMDYIGKDKILAMWKGNHDHKWERKYGTSKYAGLSERYEAPVFYGNSYIDLIVNGINYKLMGSHRLRGNSIYTNAHPATRGHREVQGLDLSFCGHTHQKGLTEQAVKEFNGARMTHSLVSGTYQLGGEYAKDSGFGTQQGDQLGMYWAVFGNKSKVVKILTTEQMLELMAERK